MIEVTLKSGFSFDVDNSTIIGYITKAIRDSISNPIAITNEDNELQFFIRVEEIALIRTYK